MLFRSRREHIVFHRSRFFQGEIIPGTEIKDVTWLRADGEEMAEADWAEGHAKLLCLLLSGEAGLMHLTTRGEQERDDTFLLIMNAAHQEVVQRLPACGAGASWQALIDTAEPLVEVNEERLAGGDEIRLPPRSSRLLVQSSAD